MTWHCPNCAAEFRTSESYDIHVGKCPVLSVEEIESVMRTYNDPKDRNVEEYVTGVAIAIHDAQVARARGTQR